MAFKFKVKKRPSLAQAAAGGFAQGVATGINRAAQLNLQDRLRKQEEEKNRLKKELDLFNGMVSDVELTQANRETIMRGKRMIIASDGKTGASTVYSSVSPDFEFMPSKEEEKAEDKLVENIEKQAMETAGMIGRQPTQLEEKERTKESEIKLGLKPIYKEEEQHDSYIWDVVRKRFEAKGVKNHNIGDNDTGHVQARSVLGPIYDHTKGNRKLSGKSPEARV